MQHHPYQWVGQNHSRFQLHLDNVRLINILRPESERIQDDLMVALHGRTGGGVPQLVADDAEHLDGGSLRDEPTVRAPQRDISWQGHFSGQPPFTSGRCDAGWQSAAQVSDSCGDPGYQATPPGGAPARVGAVERLPPHASDIHRRTGCRATRPDVSDSEGPTGPGEGVVQSSADGPTASGGGRPGAQESGVQRMT